MKSGAYYIALAFVVAAAVPSGLSQDPTAPHPSADVSTLYAHGENDDPNGWMNAVVDDGPDDALPAGQLTGGSFTWTFTLAPALSQTLLLDLATNIEITAYIGASQGAGSVTASTKILHGETLVAEGAAKSHAITPATAAPDGKYGAATWSVAPLVDRLEPGSDLIWTVTVSGQASSVFISLKDGRGRSNIVLPISATEESGLAPVSSNLTGPQVELDVSFDNTTTQGHAYNWTTDLETVDVSVNVSAQNGSVAFRIADGSDADVVVGVSNATADGSVSMHAKDVAPGNWTIQIDFAEFQGTLSIRVVATPMEAPEPGVPSPDDNGTGPPGNDTNGDGAEKVPGVGNLAILIGLVAATAVVRRRVN